jgi:hypothetical protein
MPTPYVKKEAEKHDETTQQAESKWEEAKKKARAEYGEQDNPEFWAEVMSIFKEMMGEKK